MQKRAIAVVAGVVVAVVGCGGEDRAPTAHVDPKVIHERVWIERVPRRPTDLIHVFGALEEQEPYGFFAHTSAYRMTLELVEYRRNRDTLGLSFPQTGRRVKMKFRIERCAGVRDADVCLHVDENPWGGPKKYYGLRVDRARELVPGLERARGVW